ADIGFGRAIDQFDDPALVVDAPPIELPQALGARQPADGGAGVFGLLQQSHRLWMPQRDAGVLPNYMRADYRSGRLIGREDPVAIEQCDREAERLDHLPHDIA